MNCLAAILGFLVLLLPVSAASAGESFSTAELCQVLQPCQPPAKFASGPFLEPVVIRKVTLRQIQAICGGARTAALHDHDHDTGAERIHAAMAAGALGRGVEIMGCAQLQPASCVVHVPAALKAQLPELYALILAHELGHCRGWVHARY
jgi:hypothetical protein